MLLMGLEHLQPRADDGAGRRGRCLFWLGVGGGFVTIGGVGRITTLCTRRRGFPVTRGLFAGVRTFGTFGHHCVVGLEG